MTEDERDKLLKLSKNVPYTAAIGTLYHKQQNNTKRKQRPSSETDTSKSMTALKDTTKEATKDIQEKEILKELAEESPKGHKKPRASATGLEEQKDIDPVEKWVSEPPTIEEGSKDFIEVAAAQIVRKFEESFPPTKGKDFTVLVKSFTTLDGNLTMLSSLLAEELFTQLSNSPWVGGSLRICCNPIDGGLAPNRLDGIITGSLAKIGKEIKINARLVSADTHILISSISTRIPASETAVSLLGAEITPKRPIESEDLNTRLDSLAWQVEQILYDLQGDKEVPQRLCVLDFRTLGGKKNFLGKFLAEECKLRLSKNKLWKFVPTARVEKLLGREISSISDLTITDLTEGLAGGLGIEAIIEGTVTDLGNGVKVNVKVGDIMEGLTWGTASVDILRDRSVEFLLNKDNGRVLTSGSSVNAGVVKEGLKTAYSGQKSEVSVVNRLGEDFFLREDFSDPEVVHRLLEWGNDLIITSEGEKRFLASQEPRFVNVGKKIDFPTNFTLGFEVKGSSKYWNTLKFADVSGNEFGLDFQLNEGNCYIVLPGPKSVRVRVDTNSANKFKLVRKNGFYEVYVNDTLALAGPYSKYTQFKSFTITARLDQIRFTGFLGKVIKG
ncbi:MAG: hypothetical protein ACE5IC_00345 [Candidatus Brocadiales bacterium]